MDTIGNYQLTRKLAHGGMAEIFLGRPTDGSDDGKEVVIKRILPHLAHDPRFVAMFLNEAQLAAHMHHPNVVQVMEFGEENGRLFMVMEFVDGLDCWRFAKRSVETERDYVGAAVYIIRKVLDALAYAHNMRDVNGKRLGVVHRDLSPSNIYLSRKGAVKLGDFGIAHIDSTRFRPVQIIPKGKFGYMAPEQVEGNPVDMRADVYSAGVVLCELLIRQQLFSGSSRLSVALDIREGRLEQLEHNAEKIPAGLRQILEGALARNPNDRFRSATEFNEALAVYAETLDRGLTRTDFAAQVERAMAAGQDSTDARASDIGAIARTMAGQEVLGMQMTRPDGITAVDAIATMDRETGTPITMDFEQMTGDGKYWAQTSKDSRIGPTSFAHIIELIYSDKVTDQTPISRDGHHFSPAGTYEELLRHLPVNTPTAHTDIATPKRRGLLEMESPSNVLLTLAATGETGVLICETGGKRKEVYLRGGTIIYVGSNESTELLGEYLVKKGVIERMELEMALALLPKFHGHLGDTLIALGIMTAVDLFRHITGQITERVEELAVWKNGQYEFFEGVEVRKGALEVQVDTVSFVRDFLIKTADQLNPTEIFNSMGNDQVGPTPLSAQLLGRLHLPPEYADIISRLSGWTPIPDVGHAARKAGVVPGKLIFIALESGLWRYDGTTIPWRSN